MKVEELLQQPEGRKYEFKESLPKKGDLNKTVVAFANDAGGEIFIGIQDRPRKVVGVDEDESVAIEETISNSIHSNCKPKILPDISFLRIDGLLVIRVKIYKGNNPPYFLKNKGIEKGTYIRVGSTNQVATREITEELKRQKLNISFDRLPVYQKPLVETQYDTFKHHFAETVGEPLTHAILKKLKLVHQQQGQLFPTHAMILLSDDDLRSEIFPYAKIECARFKGVVPGYFIDQKTIDSALSKQAENAYEFILRHISKGSTYEGVYRKDRWEYPLKAIREVIRNAVIHRDYVLRGKDIKVAIFDHKIEITSPGKLLPTIDFNDMEAGQSDIRNLVLAGVFKKMGIIEQWGNGLRIIADEMKQYPAIKLHWKEPGITFRVTFEKISIESGHNKGIIHDSTSNYERLRTITNDYERLRTITNDYERLDEDEKKILLYLLDNTKITRKVAVNLIKHQNTKTYEILNTLVRKELIERKGKGRGTYYTLTLTWTSQNRKW